MTEPNMHTVSSTLALIDSWREETPLGMGDVNHARNFLRGRGLRMSVAEATELVKEVLPDPMPAGVEGLVYRCVHDDDRDRFAPERLDTALAEHTHELQASGVTHPLTTTEREWLATHCVDAEDAVWAATTIDWWVDPEPDGKPITPMHQLHRVRSKLALGERVENFAGRMPLRTAWEWEANLAEAEADAVWA